MDTPKHNDLFDKGCDAFGQNPLTFSGSEVNQRTKTYFNAGNPSNFIMDGDIVHRLNVVDGYMQSDGFVSGSTGWRIDSDGNAEFESGDFRGDITGASGTFSSSLAIGTNGLHVDTDGNMWWGSSASYAAATIKISSAGVVAFTSGAFTGALTAGAGSTINGTYLTNGSVTDAKVSNLAATSITTGTLVVARTQAKCTDANADQTSVNTAANIAGQGALATLSAVGTGQINTTVISGGKIVTGLLTANNIQAGTLTGRTVVANGGAGIDVLMSNDGTIYFKYGSSTRAYMQCYSDSSLRIDADNNINLRADSVDTYYEMDNDGSDTHWRAYNDNMKMKLTSGGELQVEDNVVDNAGIDFAEYFESVSGEPIKEGVTVVLEGDKIRPAKKNEEPIGAISATAGFICGGGEMDCGESWAGKYLKDELGNYIMEKKEFWRKKTYNKKGRYTKKRNWSDIEPPPKGAKTEMMERKKINPEWDKTQKYIPRKERPEWNIVGLLGQVRVLKGQPVSKNWIKMKKISDKVDLYLIK